MIGLTPRTSSPSSSTTSRSTPCVAGWCGPMLTVLSSSVRSSLRSGVLTRSWLNPPSAVRSAITALVVGEGDGLAADREVAPLRPADVVVGQQDPGQVRMGAEDDPEEVVALALLEVGGGEQLDAGVDGGECVLGRRVGQHRFDPAALHPVAVEELVVDGETAGRGGGDARFPPGSAPVQGRQARTISRACAYASAAAGLGSLRGPPRAHSSVPAAS